MMMKKYVRIAIVIALALLLIGADTARGARRGGGGRGSHGAHRGDGGGSAAHHVGGRHMSGRRQGRSGPRHGRGTIRHSGQGHSYGRAKARRHRRGPTATQQRVWRGDDFFSQRPSHFGSLHQSVRNHRAVRGSFGGGSPRFRRTRGSTGSVIRTPRTGRAIIGRPRVRARGSFGTGRRGFTTVGPHRRGHHGRRAISHLPRGHKRTHFRGRTHFQHNFLWYRPYWFGASIYYWPVYPPIGYYYDRLPIGYNTLVIGGESYYYADGVYYSKDQDRDGYIVADDLGDAAGYRKVITEDPCDPDPFDILREMSSYVGELQHFKIVSTHTFDELLDSGENVQLSRVHTHYVSRPDKIMIEIDGDAQSKRIFYDGKTLTRMDRNENMYAALDVPPTIDAMMEFLAEDYGISIPLSDLISAKPYQTAMDRTLTSQYMGLHKVAGRECHHLAFTSAVVDWQIWIQADGSPVPRKIVITYKEQPGVPRYVVVINAWKDLSSISPAVYKFEPPVGAEQIEIMPMEDKASVK